MNKNGENIFETCILQACNEEILQGELQKIQDEMCLETDSADGLSITHDEENAIAMIFGWICTKQIEKETACSTQPHTKRSRLHS